MTIAAQIHTLAETDTAPHATPQSSPFVWPSEVDEPDDYSEACRKGRAMADHFLTQMAEQEFPPALGYAVRRMLNKGRFGGVEIGFLNSIAVAACRGSG